MSKLEYEAPNCTPQVDLSRNEYGLRKNVNYIFKENGKVDWRAMIPTKYLVPNRQKFEKAGKEVPPSAEGLSDSDLLVLLFAFVELADLRGFTSLKYTPEKTEDHDVVVKCSMQFIPNYETGDFPITYEGLANASTQNTNSFGKYFLAPIAANRAFIQCVRKFLEINIVGFDEIAPVASEDTQHQKLEVNNIAYKSLENVLKKNDVSLEKLKTVMQRDNVMDIEEISKIHALSDIPSSKILGIIEYVQKSLDKKSKKAKKE